MACGDLHDPFSLLLLGFRVRLVEGKRPNPLTISLLLLQLALESDSTRSDSPTKIIDSKTR